MSKKFFAFLSLLIVASMILAACGPANNGGNNMADNNGGNNAANNTTDNGGDDAATNNGGNNATTEEDAAPEFTSDRTGAWVDQVAMSVVGADSGITQLEAGAIDVFASSLMTPSEHQAMADAGLTTADTFGLYYELTINPYGPVFDGNGKLNPFADPAMREAMQWLIDRDYIIQEVYGGAGLAKFFPVTTGFPDYTKHVEYARALEAQYAYDFDRAAAQIEEVMTNLGATKSDAGIWQYEGEDVVIIFLIRNDSDGTRIPIGDYISSQLEQVGFVVDRQYKTSSEASAIWVGGDVAEGLWHIYTGAWSTSAISRDDAGNFVFFYSPKSAYGFTSLWTSYEATLSDEANEVFDALNESSFTTPEERAELFSRALELTFDINTRIWLVDGQGKVPWAPNVSVAADLAAGITTNRLWPYTIRFIDDAGLPVEGGLLRWGAPDIFVDPANPIGGSNWTYDSMWEIATQDQGVIANPATGIAIPQRIESADLVVTEGLPIGATYDWVNLSFAPEVAVPADAWGGWDAEAGTFTEVGEGVTANLMSRVYYPADLFETMTWHDGSPLSPADFIMGMIMTFATGTEGSPVYDEAQAGALEAYLGSFRGVKVVSVDPLVIEHYTDAWTLDAENNVTTWWPVYGYGTAAWHNIAVGNAAEAAGTLAYTADKAEANEVEWTNFIAGPSLEILAGHLDELAASGEIPFVETLGDYITAEEAAARYANLQAWYAAHNHFWVGTGPFYLDEVFSVEKTATLTRYEAYPDLATRWLQFSAPKLAEVEIDGAGRVTIGSEATFSVYVTYEGEAYPGDEIAQVKYLLFDATGAIVEVGEADFVADGEYAVNLSADSTALLTAGSGKLEVAVVAIPVAIPSFGAFEFVAE